MHEKQMLNLMSPVMTQYFFFQVKRGKIETYKIDCILFSQLIFQSQELLYMYWKSDFQSGLYHVFIDTSVLIIFLLLLQDHCPPALSWSPRAWSLSLESVLSGFSWVWPVERKHRHESARWEKSEVSILIHLGFYPKGHFGLSVGLLLRKSLLLQKWPTLYDSLLNVLTSPFFGSRDCNIFKSTRFIHSLQFPIPWPTPFFIPFNWGIVDVQ